MINDKLRLLTGLREEAEKLGVEQNDCHNEFFTRTGLVAAAPCPSWLVEVQLDLLSDLSRPESRDALVRMCEKADRRWDVFEHVFDPVWGENNPSVEYVTRGLNRETYCAYETAETAESYAVQNRRAYWSGLRDDPDALLTAALEVLL